nr:MAG TPA: hypothetical protein [Caudoviricetes sp.]
MNILLQNIIPYFFISTKLAFLTRILLFKSTFSFYLG